MSLDLNRARKAARGVARFAAKNPKRPSSGDIHKLRSRARSLTAAFVALGLDSDRRIKRLLPDLEEIQKKAGKVRDMDVLTANALTLTHDGEQDCLVQLLEDLGARRNRAARKLRRFLGARGPRLRQDLKRSSRRAEKRSSDASTEATSRAMEISAKLSRGRLGKGNLHEYRLELKEFRDVLRLSDRTDSMALLKDLAEAKDAIGDWHDWVELSNIARSRLDHGRSCKLARLVESTTRTKLDHALSLSNGLRHRYFGPKQALVALTGL